MLKKFHHTLLLGTSLALFPIAAHAQDAIQAKDSDAQNSEILVTANRRGDATTQNTPMAISAVSGDALQNLGVSSVADLTKVVPSLEVKSYGAGQQTIIIRGISSSVGATAGIYLDEAPVKGGYNNNNYGDGTPSIRMHDINHVEVLEGPQGTLFGSGSMNGTLRVITNQPKLNETEGSVAIAGATIDGGSTFTEGSAMFNLPLVEDKLGLRVVAWGENGGGFIDQTINGAVHANVNKTHLYGGRATLRFVPTERLALTASYTYQKTDVDGAQGWTQELYSYTQQHGANQGPFPKYTNHEPIEEPYSSTYRLGVLSADYDIGGGSIIATFTDSQNIQSQVSDNTGFDCLNGLCLGAMLPFPFTPGPNNNAPTTPITPSAHGPSAFTPVVNLRTTTGELRFASKFEGPFQIVAGGYYESSRQSSSGTVTGAAPDGSIPCITYEECASKGLLSIVEFANKNQRNVKQYALYAQGDLEVVPNLTLTAGIRYFSATLTNSLLQQVNIAPATLPNGNLDVGWIFGGVTTPYIVTESSAKQSKTTYNFSLLWAPSRNLSLYARAASGFRIGGINQSAQLALQQQGVVVPPSYAPDSLWNYEAGVKAYLFDRALNINASVFRIDWSGQQLPAIAVIYTYTLNAAKTKTTGAQFSFDYRLPGSGLTFGGSFNYVDSKLAADLPAAVVNAGTPGFKGDRLPYVPKVSYSGRIEYAHPVSDDFEVYAGTSFTYHGSSHSEFQPTARDITLHSYFLQDARVGVRSDLYDISLYVQNLTNKAAELGGNSEYSRTIFLARPRTIGIKASARF